MNRDFDLSLDIEAGYFSDDEEEPLKCTRCGWDIDDPDLWELSTRICYFCEKHHQEPPEDEQPCNENEN